MQISVTQYSKIRGISRQAILKQIKKGKSLPNITSYEKVGATYVLTYSGTIATKLQR